MRKFVTAIAIATVALAGGAASAKQTLAEKGQAKLEKMLQGRVAGKPVSCISTLQNSNLTVIDKTALVYGTGTTIYVNRTKDPRWIDRDDILVTHPTQGGQLCKLDSVRTVDRGSRMPGAAILLEDFVPYTKLTKVKHRD